jgi:hypothetical protein
LFQNECFGTSGLKIHGFSSLKTWEADRSQRLKPVPKSCAVALGTGFNSVDLMRLVWITWLVIADFRSKQARQNALRFAIFRGSCSEADFQTTPLPEVSLVACA